MTQSQSPNPDDRLARVEAALENQVEVIAELRTSNEILRTSVRELTSTAESVLRTLNQHQDNFLVLVTEIRDIRTDIRRILDRLD
ncbi:hypothetical protein NIES4071_109710 (plasmid) [Calothrix sp. NIES-4071]|nr:hypothetical protein NIES4071_109710 [Calothrix sp. NIES-4071]BAZ65221.1 hypothetical protein NIES4105_109540 [Calothrix sp. NIES-4105]